MNTLTKAFVDCYQQLDKDSLACLSEVYHRDIEFQDPANRLKGFDALYDYFQHLYQNIEYCQFDVSSQLVNQQSAFITWTMTFKHKRLKKTVTVEGASQLHFDQNKVIFHRDYFDLGSLVYEQIPLLGSIVRRIKKNLAPSTASSSTATSSTVIASTVISSTVISPTKSKRHG